MSIKRVVKLLKNIRSFSDEYSKEQNPFYREKTKDLGKEIRDRLVDGLYGQYDIEGDQFKALKPATVKGKGSDWPLVAKNKNIKNFLEGDDLLTTGTLQVTLNRIPDAQGAKDPRYMEAQNEGWYKNVPARTWYGIPKTYREGGGKYKEFINRVAKALDIEFGKAIKKG